MSKKTRTTSQSQNSSTSTVTPNNPTWVSQGLEGMGGALSRLAGMDPKSFIAGPSALQSSVFKDAAGLTSSPFFKQAGDVIGKVAGAGANTYNATQGSAVGYDPSMAEAASYTASSGLEGLDRYMSPYTQNVVDASLADFDYGAGQTRAQQALDEARSGAFGGSGAAITRSMTEDSLNRGRALTAANLRDQGFTRGAGLSFQDAAMRNEASRYNADALNRVNLANADARNNALAALAASRNQFGIANMDAQNNASRFNAQAMDAALARQLQAGGALADLGSASGADSRANLALQGSLGADQRAIEQAQASAPLDVLKQLSAMWGGLPLDLLRGVTTNSSGTASGSGTEKTYDPWGTLTNLINAGANVISARG